MLSAEHRSATGAGPLPLELANAESAPYLSLAPAPHPSELVLHDPIPKQILALLAQSSEPRTAETIRSSLQVRNQRLVEALRRLVEQHKIVRSPQGYVLASSTLTIPSSSPRVAPR